MEKKEKKPRGYWTYERCKEEALKYTSKKEFKDNSVYVYDISAKNKWLDEWDWLEGKKSYAYWDNKEHCLKEARKYETKKEFEKHNQTAYAHTWKNGWMPECDWFKSLKPHQDGYWTYERCYEAAKECGTKVLFQKNYGGAYHKSCLKGWIDLFDCFEETRKPNNYWTYERCYEAAKECQSKTEFNDKYPIAYQKSVNCDWIDKFDWFVTPQNETHSKDDHGIYSYEDVDNKVVYVGITKDFKRRDREHRFGLKKKGIMQYSTPNKYFKSVDKELPKMKILITDLYAEDAQYYEDWYIERYKCLGWVAINIAKTGVGKSSLGAGNLKWSEEKCFNAARECSTFTEFRKKYLVAYNKSVKMGWINNFDWLVKTDTPKGFWKSYDNCYAAARECKTITEFERKYAQAYNVSNKNGWIKNYDWFISSQKPNGYWTYERCYEAAKECGTKNGLRKKYVTAYNVSLKNKWLDEWFGKCKKKPNGYWNYENCKKEASRYDNRWEFQTSNYGAYFQSWKNGWLDEFFPKAA